jgi:hypothetical protein
MISKYDDFLLEKNITLLLEGEMSATDDFIIKLK